MTEKLFKVIKKFGLGNQVIEFKTGEKEEKEAKDYIKREGLQIKKTTRINVAGLTKTRYFTKKKGWEKLFFCLYFVIFLVLLCVFISYTTKKLKDYLNL